MVEGDEEVGRGDVRWFVSFKNWYYVRQFPDVWDFVMEPRVTDIDVRTWMARDSRCFR